MTISEYVDTHRDELVRLWLVSLRKLEGTSELPEDALVDSLPQFLHMLSELLLRFGREELPDPEQPPREIVALARRHGQQRIELGIPFDVVVQEYGMLRDLLLQAFEGAGLAVHPREARVLTRLISFGEHAASLNYAAERVRRQEQLVNTAQAKQTLAETTLAQLRSAQAALSESEERYRLLVESVRDYSVFMLTPEGRVAGWNPGAQRVKGYLAEEILGKPLSVFFPREEVAERVPDRLLARALRDGGAQYEGWLLRKSGERFWGVLSVDAVRDREGALRGYSNVSRDYSDRKRLEEEQEFLAEAGQVLAGSLDYTTTLTQVVHLATERLADWCAIFVRDAGPLVPTAMAHADPERMPLLRRALQKVHLEGNSRHGLAWVVRTGRSELCEDTREGAWVRPALGVGTPEQLIELRACSYLCVPMTARGQTSGAIVVVSANPRHRYGFSELRLAEELARRCAAAVDNARLFREAQEAVRARDEFISMASHDLRTPLATLRLHVQAMSRAARDARKPIGGEPLQAKLAVLDHLVDRIVRMMDNLLDITRITSGKLELNRREHDLVEIVREVTARFDEELERSGSELRIIADAPVEGDWDRFRLEQVVSNLLSNAIKYGAGRPITITVNQDDDRARLSVRDQGIGIPVEEQHRLFQRFERIRPDARVAGYGVGLWIVQRIVQAHGGTVEVESAPGGGAEFVVELPSHPLPLGEGWGEGRGESRAEGRGEGRGEERREQHEPAAGETIH